jgi:filamentous hemagglutinin
MLRVKTGKAKSNKSAIQKIALLFFSAFLLTRISAPMAQAYSPYLHHSFVAPTSNLYSLHRDPGHTYLIETDHRFTDYKTYTSSDYLLSRLSIDPTLAQKRLGDGFYEQKLISDQITQLTGRRFVGQYTSVEDQTRALMDSSANTAKQLNLSTGIALSREQAAALTQDIVWMVEETIHLNDGSTTTALVPRVYLSAQHAIDLTPDGALIAADVIDINIAGNLDNSGTLKSTTASMIAARDILNTGNIGSSGDILLKASNDISNISNISGSIAGRRVALSAGNNLLNSTATMSITSGTARLGGKKHGARSCTQTFMHSATVSRAVKRRGGL